MTGYDVVIIGGGPAGLVAAGYCLHAQLNAVIMTPELGGKVNYPFALRDLKPENVVWGAQLVAQFEQMLAEAKGLPHLMDQAASLQREADGSFVIRTREGETIRARTVILATGAAPQRLYVEGEREYWGRGVSFSAISHAPYFSDRAVAVVGGGRRTLVAALELAQIARQVYLIAARPQSMAELPEAALVQGLSNVTAFSNWEVQAIVGDEYVQAIQLVGVNGETRQLSVDGVFVQLALLPNSELVRNVAELDAGGHVIVNHRCETSVPGLFAAGDVTNIQSEQVLVAIGEGAKAALSAWEYLVTHP